MLDGIRQRIAERPWAAIGYGLVLGTTAALPAAIRRGPVVSIVIDLARASVWRLLRGVAP